jgi:alpha-L-fucosidase 2
MRVTLSVGALLAAATACNATAGASQSDLDLLYDKPARVWTEALPVGNGRIGAMVFGGTEDERLQINETTLWGGGPHDYATPKAYTRLEEIRRLIFAGKVAEAERLSDGLMGQPKLLMPYQPFCDVRLHFQDHAQASGYRRDLNLEDAIAQTAYQVGSARFHREVFVSYPDQVLVMRITGDEAGQITFDLALDSPQAGARVQAITSDTLQLTGQIQPRSNPLSSWVGSWSQPGIRFAAVLKVMPEGGSVHEAAGHLQVSSADAVTILFSNATGFRNFRDVGGDALLTAARYVERASQYSYAHLRRRHVDDFRALFSRVRLRLGDSQSTQTTDRRLQSFAQNQDPGLLALYFEFGRYLLISSSRPGGQPANLQGIWNEDLTPTWGSKWTTNINLQMNYWQADGGDLWETEQPLWSLIRDLRVTGAQTARLHYHAKGWVLHHNTDLWRATTPVDGPWGIWPLGGVWLANQMWDHYQFSQDRQFLRQQAYPAMRDAAKFALGILVQAPAGTAFAGRLVANPSTSPENEYLLNGKRVHLTYAASMDIELIRELFENCQHAAEILGTDSGFRSQLERAQRRLPPLQIGTRGQLQEWIEDYPEADPSQRHTSHLYALYPGHDITLQTTPELATAARRTLELRGDGGTGWSRVWRTALWARLQNPERAYANLNLLIINSTLPNLFDLCPPFQIDGNLGAPGAMIEMLVQSTTDEINLLPALPPQWPEGSLSGVRLRGGAKADLQWAVGALTAVTLRADHAMTYTVRYGAQSAEVHIEPDEPVTLDGALRRDRR